jgi:hypothetical protein
MSLIVVVVGAVDLVDNQVSGEVSAGSKVWSQL